MNLLAFDSLGDYIKCLNDTGPLVRCGFNKFPTVCNETMMKYAKNKWDPDYPYVVLLNMYQKEKVDEFRGKRLVVIDGSDKPKYHYPYADWANIYVKENSYVRTPNGVSKRVRVGCYCPSVKVPFTLLKHKIRWQEEKKLDVFFCGDPHYGRGREMKRLAKICKNLGLKYKVGDSHAYSRPKYLEMMSKTKICPSWSGHGDRCRREMEAMLSGSLLLNDMRLIGYPIKIIKPASHFLFQSHDLSEQIRQLTMGTLAEQVAKNGYDLMQKCWMRAPSIDIRMAALYLFFDLKQLNTYEEVEKEEHGMRKKD